ncbi:MAG: ParB/RepB/Spo0J family partition protein [Bacteroidota bacterium]
MENGIHQLKLKEIRVSDLNPRKTINQSSIEELAQSIKEVGVLSPIMVRTNAGKGCPFEIIYGERRYRAAALAGLEIIPAIVRTQVTDSEALDLMITENLQREDVKPLEDSFRLFN